MNQPALGAASVIVWGSSVFHGFIEFFLLIFWTKEYCNNKKKQTELWAFLLLFFKFLFYYWNKKSLFAFQNMKSITRNNKRYCNPSNNVKDKSSRHLR